MISPDYERNWICDFIRCISVNKRYQLRHGMTVVGASPIVRGILGHLRMRLVIAQFSRSLSVFYPFQAGLASLDGTSNTG